VIGPAELRARRFFRSKGRKIAAIAERDAARIGGERLALVDVAFEEGPPETYVLAGEPDALEGEALPRALLAAIAAEARVATERGGRLAFRRGPSFASGGAGRVARMGAEQTNTSLLFDRRLVLKIFRKIEDGLHPELEVLEFLAERTSFRHVPPFAGAIEYEGPGLVATLGVLEGFVESAGDGWTWALAERPGGAAWRLLGERTRALHQALASRPDVPAFAPEPVRPEDAGAWAEGAERLVERALRLAGPAGRAEEVGALEAPLRERVRAIAAIDVRPLRKARCHGDYHLGQVLRTRDDFVIFDFEGEPARPIAERRRKQPQVKDVAGMLRSFGYAARVGGAGPNWEAEARAGFLEGYGLAEAERPLLAALEVEKAIYELCYEIDNRPDWVEIPLAALRALLGTSARQA
jgi:predicted trehalose synthase